MKQEPEQIWKVGDYAELRVYRLLLKPPGYRIEVTLEETFYWHTGVFSEIDHAVNYGLKECSSSHLFGHPLLTKHFLPLEHDLGREEIYRGWFICDCFEITDGDVFALDPLTNRCYSRESIEEAKELIDLVEQKRFVAPGQMSLNI